MQLEHILCPGLLVQSIDILGYRGLDQAIFFQLGQSEVRRVRLGLPHFLRQWAQPIEENLGLALESGQGGHTHGIIFGPKAGMLRSEIRDT